MFLSVSVRGAPKELREFLRQATGFYLKRLMPRKRNVIEVSLILIGDLDTKENIVGDTNPDFDHESKFPEVFTIRLQYKEGDNIQDLFKTLAHECAHVAQYATGKMRHCKKNPNVVIWNGKRISEKVSYWEAPWEIDADGRCRGLFVLWSDTIPNRTDYTWMTYR